MSLIDRAILNSADEQDDDQVSSTRGRRKHALSVGALVIMHSVTPECHGALQEKRIKADALPTALARGCRSALAVAVHHKSLSTIAHW